MSRSHRGVYDSRRIITAGSHAPENIQRSRSINDIYPCQGAKQGSRGLYQVVHSIIDMQKLSNVLRTIYLGNILAIYCTWHQSQYIDVYTPRSSLNRCGPMGSGPPQLVKDLVLSVALFYPLVQVWTRTLSIPTQRQHKGSTNIKTMIYQRVLCYFTQDCMLILQASPCEAAAMLPSIFNKKVFVPLGDSIIYIDLGEQKVKSFPTLMYPFHRVLLSLSQFSKGT